MKREILFRGKEKAGYSKFNKGKWIYGSLLQKEGSTAIAKTANIILDCYGDIDNSSSIPVKSSTVGQYTGIKDKNGTRIFEGDIILYNEDGFVFTAGYVVYNNCSFYVKSIAELWEDCRLHSLEKNTSIEVMGNIYDNPELIK